MASPTSPTTLTTDQVRHIARLARITLTDAEVETNRSSLAAVVAYMDRLRALDLSQFEPLAHVGDEHNRLDDDALRVGLSTQALLNMAPEGGHWQNFVRVPKVLGDGGGA